MVRTDTEESQCSCRWSIRLIALQLLIFFRSSNSTQTTNYSNSTSKEIQRESSKKLHGAMLRYMYSPETSAESIFRLRLTTSKEDPMMESPSSTFHLPSTHIAMFNHNHSQVSSGVQKSTRCREPLCNSGTGQNSLQVVQIQSPKRQSRSGS